ncbi:hypothetical protein, partial [Methylobacter sp.]|uniref:hypothetical protein n=1 Tax=Methylobacter sp. TaxID=2051955 RepID=UPI003DA5F7C1
SHPKASYFLLRGQKKVTKEKAARLPLASCAPRFHRGLPEGSSLALWQRAASLQRPYGLFSPKAAVLGAANGMEPPVRNINC